MQKIRVKLTSDLFVLLFTPVTISTKRKIIKSSDSEKVIIEEGTAYSESSFDKSIANIKLRARKQFCALS